MVKKSQNDPLYPSIQFLDEVDSEIKDIGKFIMIKQKNINNPFILGVGVDKYL